MKWFFFPFNYDPTWGPDECAGKDVVPKEEYQADETETIMLAFMVREHLSVILED